MGLRTVPSCLQCGIKKKKKATWENNSLNVKRERGTSELRFICGPCGVRGFAVDHAVPEHSYVPRVILVRLEKVFLAEVVFRHIGAAQWKKRLVQIKVHSIFSSSLSLFCFSAGSQQTPQNQLILSIKAIFKQMLTTQMRILRHIKN